MKRLIYGQKQTSRHWDMKFDKVVTSLEFEENIVDNAYTLRLMLAYNDVGMVCETKQT